MRLSPKTGLGALLRKPSALDEFVVSYPDVPNLFVLPAGPINLSVDTKLLGSSFQDLVDRRREEFDHTIIVTPPIRAMTARGGLPRRALSPIVPFPPCPRPQTPL